MIHLEKVLKISLQDVFKTSWRHLEDVLKTFRKMSWIRFHDVLKTSWQRLEDVLARCLEDVLKTSWKHLENVLKTSWRGMASKDLWLRWIYSSWSKPLEDILKTSSEDEDERRLEDVFKTCSSRRMFAGY